MAEKFMVKLEDSQISVIFMKLLKATGNIENTKPITIAKKQLANWKTNNITYGFTHLITS